MRTYLAMSCAILATLLGSAVTVTAQNSDTDSAHAVAFVKDSAITTKIKTKLAAEHMSSLGDIHVDTDKDGVVWLSGSVKTKKAADRAVAIARATAHVKKVHSDIRVAESD
ncbi:MAG TPA: BON domain-containing protein [Acidobacteriaceae bacterium]|jgi:hyperosmotically inducible periplasmic protein|nr:BON domain-containing protein [Acidobacteriaceae bacterium]